MSEPRPNLRARQAELTRQAILGAARQLFGEQGYSRTTVRDIARAAGVSSQTVYDSVGTKQAVVAQLNDLIDDEAGIGPLAAGAMASGDPARIAALPGTITCSILEHCGDVIRALVSGAAAEADLEAAMAEGQRRHRDGARRVVAALGDLGALPADLDREAAVETVSANSDVRIALLLQESYGWSLERIGAWITTANQALLLGPDRA